MLVTQKSLIIRLRKAGSKADWDEFWDLYKTPILAYARSRGLTEPEDCKEVLQETMIKISRGGVLDFDPEKARFTQTLMQIVRCATIDAWRRNERRRRRDGGSFDEEAVEGSLPLREQIEGRDIHPGRIADAHAELEIIRIVLNRLVERGTFERRTVEIFLAAAAGESASKDVAAEFGTTQGNVDQAKLALRKRLRAVRAALDEGMGLEEAIEASDLGS